MSLRKRLRAQAAEELDKLVIEVQTKAAELTEGVDSMWGTDLLKLASGGRTDTIRDKLITRLTNHKEHELEKFFNRQQELLEEPAAEKPPAKGKSK